MKAVRFTSTGNPLVLQEIPVPRISENEILVRVKAAGVCHSDEHYRAGISKPEFLPITFGHEVAGIVEQTGREVTQLKQGDRVALHYLVSCGMCFYCMSGHEQFCDKVKMLGKNLNGGFAEYIAVPSRNAVNLPGNISFEEGAVLMCAGATAYHCLLKAKLEKGNTVAVFGAGGVGQSVIQLATVMGAGQIIAVDINEEKLRIARQFGAVSINSKKVNPVIQIKNITKGRGVDVAVEVIGIPQTQKQALHSVAPLGRVVIVGLSDAVVQLDTYHELLQREAQIIGSNDHCLNELAGLIQLASEGKFNVSGIVSRKISLDADEINNTLDDLARHQAAVRTVIIP
ncbi:MAG: zinc-binding dehydrogenase [Bacteroidia bacterium]|nr:zinc-binding dehydrogenase [Bacteroidia bacterium]MCZ2278212.1 zinc-binding dehydrogenase [Bacteroidia bacterium]